MKTYLRNFYPQDSSLIAEMNYIDLGSKFSNFGLIGEEYSIIFNLVNRNLFFENSFIGSLGNSNSVHLKVLCENSVIYILLNEIPVKNINKKFKFYKVFCESEDNFNFIENIKGIIPKIELNFSEWKKDGSGEISINIDLEHDLEIYNLGSDSLYANILNYPRTVSKKNPGKIIINYEGKRKFCSEETIVFYTSAGIYKTNLKIDYK